MIRPLTIVTFMMACGSGLYLYQSKHEAQVLDRTIERTLRETATFREQSRLLAAEWTMLNDPESLRRFSDTHLALKTIAPSQFTSLADLDNRLPPVPMPASAADTPEEAGEPVAAVAPPPSPSADIPPADIAGDGVHVASRPLPPLSASNTPVASVPAVARPAERKVAVSRPAPTDLAYRPAATDPAPPSRVSASLRVRASGPACRRSSSWRSARVATGRDERDRNPGWGHPSSGAGASIPSDGRCGYITSLGEQPAGRQPPAGRHDRSAPGSGPDPARRIAARHGAWARRFAAPTSDADQRGAIVQHQLSPVSMTNPTDHVPPPDPASPGRFGRPMPRVGASRADAVPRMEHVRVTAPDLARRAAMERTRSRLVIAAAGFCVLFAAVLGRLAVATIVTPLAPHRVERPVAEIVASVPRGPIETTLPGQRAMITDRNGQPMAISLNTVSLFADPRQIADPEDVAQKLKQVLPRLDLAETVDRLKRDKKFIYLAREITPREEQTVNNLGIPGVDFRPTQHRQYPLGRTAAQVLGGVDADQSGFAGVEKYFDARLKTNPEPLRLSIDLQVQAAVREELLAAMQTFEAIGGCGIVMDVHTGELLAMVSLPDYDANSVRTAPGDDRFNRAVEGRYEPGSTFKLQTASMALDGGIVHIWDEFDASRNISIGRYHDHRFRG